jgi:hypothetical protein
MKKLTNILLAACLLLTFNTTQLSASVAFTPGAANTEAPAASKAAMERLAEIKSLDKSNMSSREKKELRKEARNIKKMQKAISGVYLSVGAIIIIILLLILIL